MVKLKLILEFGKDRKIFFHLNAARIHALDGDMQGVINTGTGELLTMTLVSDSVMNSEEFDRIVREWIKTAKHPQYPPYRFSERMGL